MKFEKATFPYRGAGKSVAIGTPDGTGEDPLREGDPRVHRRARGGQHATELIHELLLGKAQRALPEDIATMIHAHPTLSEAVMEAARAAEGWAIHVIDGV